MEAWNICLTHDPAYGGLYRAVNDFAAAIPARTLSFDDGRRDRSALTREDRAYRVRCGGNALSRDCLFLSSAAVREAEHEIADADLLVVHSMFRGHASWAANWARLHGRRFWAVPHGCLDPWGLSRRKMAKSLWLMWHGRSFLGRANCIVFSTQGELNKARPWLTRLGISNHVTVIHWPVLLPSLEDRDVVRSAWRNRHGIPESAVLLLSVGRLHSMKRPLETVRAFLSASGNDDHLAIVGMDGDLQRDTISQYVPKEFRKRVHVTGHLSGNELRAAWLAGDGFISLSFRENFGYSVAEAVSYGLPVILSPGHDLAADMPQDANGRLACGWLLPDDSQTAAVEAIKAFLKQTRVETSSCASMCAAGRRWASEVLSPKQFGDRLHAIATT